MLFFRNISQYANIKKTYLCEKLNAFVAQQACLHFCIIYHCCSRIQVNSEYLSLHLQNLIAVALVKRVINLLYSYMYIPMVYK